MAEKRIFFLPGILIGLVFAIIIFQSMSWGPWAYNDSSAYISAARNLAVGNGSVILHTTGKIKQLTEFPPFYPFFLSNFGGAEGDYVAIIRVINTALFAASIFFFYLIVYKLNNNVTIASIATLMFASFRPNIEIFTGAMSETLFIFLLFLAFYFLMQYFKNTASILWFVLLTLVSALLPITRYAGILFAGLFGISILFLSQKQALRWRIRNTIIFCMIAFLPIGIWAASLINKYDKFAGKNFNFGWSIFQSVIRSLQSILQVIKLWIPYTSEYADTWLAVILFLFGVLFFILIIVMPFIQLRWKKEQNHDPILAFILVINLAILGYFGLIIFMHTTSSPPIDIIDRTLLPVFPLTLISASYAITSLFRKISQKLILSLGLILMSAIFLRYQYLITKPYLQNLSENGIGYTAKKFIQSGTINAIHNIDRDRILISNLSGFVLFHDNRYPIFIENFPHYAFGAGDSYGEREFREANAALIIMRSEFENFYGTSADDLLTKVTDSHRVEYEDAECIILSYGLATQP
jgi:4-amino-4-deoxy-L-arabinose transferase-like glycosyltransferase